MSSGRQGPAKGVTATAILLVAVWVGLIAGFTDAALVVIHRCWIERDFLRLGEDFAWLIPVGVTMLVLIPAVVLALIARLRGRAIGLGTVVGLLSFVGFLDASARFPIEAWAALLLSGGLATQFAHLVGRRGTSFLRLVRRTMPILGVLLLASVLATVGRRVGRMASQSGPAPGSSRRETRS